MVGFTIDTNHPPVHTKSPPLYFDFTPPIFECLVRFCQVVDGAEWLYKKPLLAPEEVSRMSRAVEQRSRAMGPTSKL